MAERDVLDEMSALQAADHGPGFDDASDHVQDEIMYRMYELGLGFIVLNWEEVADGIRNGDLDSEFIAILDVFADPANAARYQEAIGVVPHFEQLILDYRAMRTEQISEIEETLESDPMALQQQLMEAFGDGFEPALGFLNTQARMSEILADSLRESTPPETSFPWELRIGASRFSVPPINIDVSQSFRVGSLSGGALRQQSAPKFNSGHKETMINMTLYFPTHEDIWGIYNETGELTINFDKDGDSDWVIDRFLSSLRGLITQFRYAPFLPIRNEYLNRAYGITGVVLHSMSISTVEEYPFVIAVNLQMLNFNHKVYLPMIEDFHQAIHWGRYRQYMGRAAMKMNSAVGMGFLKETNVSNQAWQNVFGGGESGSVTVLEYEQEPSNIFKSPYAEFKKRGNWEDGRYFEVYYPSRTPARVFAPDMANFRAPGEDGGYEREKNSWETFLGYLGIDIDTNPEAYYDYVNNYANEITPSPQEREKLIEYLSWIGGVADVMNADALDDYINRRVNELLNSPEYHGEDELPDDVLTVLESQIKTEWFRYIFEGYKDTPFFQSYLASAEYNSGNVMIKEWEVPMEKMALDPNNVIISGVSVSMANNIARLQIQMQDEPTHQHIGGRDTRVDLALTVFGEEDLARLQRLFKHVNGLAQLEHAHGVLGFLGVKNVITALAGIKYVLPLSFEVDTIPGYPHVYNVRLSFVDFDIFQQKREELSSSQQAELVEAFGKRNPFLRIKQLWGSFNAYPDFPLSVRDDNGDIVGHLDPDYFYKSFQMIDDDVVNWDLPPSTKFSELSNFFGTTNEDSDDTNGLIPSEQINFGIDDQGNPIPDAESAPTAAEGNFWTAGNNYPAGFPVDYESSGQFEQTLRKINYKHSVKHYVGLFSEAQDEASIVAIEKDGIKIGTQRIGENSPQGEVEWLSNSNDGSGEAAKWQLHEDVAGNFQNEPFIKGNTPPSGYMQPHADESSNPYKQFELMMRDTQYRDLSGRMIRAFPTYMLWLIDEGGNFAGVKLFDNFYGLQSVIDLSVHRSEDVLGDTLVLRLSNLYQKLTSSYKGYFSDGDPATQIIDLFIDRQRNLTSGTTDAMVSLESIRLKPGVRVHLRMGYSANPNALETVFNGTITEVKQGDIVEVIAQSDAIELSPYINTTNKDGHSGKIDGAFNTGLWLSEPRDLMVRLLSMGSSTFKQAAAFATRGMIFSENRFGIRHFGTILYPPLTDEEGNKTDNIRETAGAMLRQAGGGLGEAAQTPIDMVVTGGGEFTEAGDAFSAQLGGLSVRSPVVGVFQQLWQNFFAERDYEVFKRNIYPGNGLGVAQYLGGDLLDGGVIWADKVTGAESNAAELNATSALGNQNQAVQDFEDAQAIADLGEESADADPLDEAFNDNESLGGIAGTLMDIWDNPVNPFSLVGLPGAGVIPNVGRSILGGGPFRNHPLLQMFGIAGEDDDMTGFDEVSFRAQTYMKSVWDLFQLCAALLPNYIVAVRPFEDRSTVFYGKPHWLYTSGLIPVTTGIPKSEEIDLESTLTDMVELQTQANNAVNPLADLETQLQFFKGLTVPAAPTSSTEGIEFDGSLSDVNSLPLEHPNGAVIPYRSGPIVMEQHLPTREGTQHLELPDLNPDWKFSAGYYNLNGSAGCGSFGCLEPEEEQFYMNMRWPYADWSQIGTSTQSHNPNDKYIPGQDPSIYKGTRILVYAHDTGKACVCTPGDAGPGADRTIVAGLSPDTTHVLGIHNDAVCSFAFVPDGTPLGPVEGINMGSFSNQTAAGESGSVSTGSSQVDPEDLDQVSVSVKDVSSISTATYSDPVSDREFDDKSFWFLLDDKNENDRADIFEPNFNRERERYRRARREDFSDEDFNARIDKYDHGEEVEFSIKYGWLFHHVPVWIDPQTGQRENLAENIIEQSTNSVVGSRVVDQLGINARRIYDPEYNKLFEDELAENDIIIFGKDIGGGRSLDEAEEIWDQIRNEFWDEDWVYEEFESYWQETHGNQEFEARTFYMAMEEWITYLWQDPVARAWVVLVMDRQQDKTSVNTPDIPLGILTDGVDIDASLNPLDWVGSAGNEGWNLNSSPFNDMWREYLRVGSFNPNDRSWRDSMLPKLIEAFDPGSDAQTLDEQIGDAISDMYDGTIGKLITAAALTMSGLVALFRLGLQQLGQGIDMVTDMQRQANILNRIFNDSIYYSAGSPGSILRLCDNPFTREYGEPVVEVREPFQRMHYISSFQHIINNGISETLDNVATVVTASSDGKYPVTVYMDKGAPSERQVEKAVETGLFWDNARGSGFFGFLHPLFHPIETARGVVKSATGSSDELLSKRVALYHLKEGLKDIYSGELTVLGDPEIRPFDLVYIADVYERMYGMFEVESVTHHFTPETGFITSIVPNALVTINDPARWSVISWAWSWWAVKNARDDMRHILGVKTDRGAQISDEGVTVQELADALDTQLRGHTQYTHGGSALVKDLVATRASGLALSTNDAYQSIEGQQAGTGLDLGLTASSLLGPGAAFGAMLAWPAWKWVRDNLLDQHGCYIQYLTKNGQPMDAGLSYAQGMVVGRHHSTNLLPGILGLDVDTMSPDGHRRITTDDLLASLGWQEVDVLNLRRDLSWWINRTNARILELSGGGPDPVGLGDRANIRIVTVASIANEDGDANGIIDGDTFATTDGERVRLTGVNADELQFKYNLDLNAETDRAFRARQYLQRILIDEPRERGHQPTVALRINPSNAKDTYGRTLAVVFHRVPEGVSAENRDKTLVSFAGGIAEGLPTQPFISWDQYMPDGRPYTANWDMISAGLADVDLGRIVRNDPDRGAIVLNPDQF